MTRGEAHQGMYVRTRPGYYPRRLGDGPGVVDEMEKYFSPCGEIIKIEWCNDTTFLFRTWHWSYDWVKPMDMEA